MDKFLETVEKIRPFKIKRIHKGCKLPVKMTEQAVGYDVFAQTPGQEPIVIKPLGRALVPTGFCMELIIGTEAQIRPRSGLAWKHGITVLNSPGTIDSDYRGEVKVMLVNLSDEPFEVTNGMRIAQMVIASVLDKNYVEVDKLNDTERGTGGFGSTGF